MLFLKKQYSPYVDMESSTAEHEIDRIIFERSLAELKERCEGNPVDMPLRHTDMIPTVPEKEVRGILLFLCYVVLLLH